MLRFCFAATVALSATSAFAAAFPSPPLYPSFGARKAQITDFDPTGSTLTEVIGIDAKGRAYGDYQNAKSIFHGFIRGTNGNFKILTAPNAGTGAEHGTRETAVNTAGDIAGTYEIDSDDTYHGYARIDGKFTEFDPPQSLSTTPTGINSSDAITGSFVSSESGVQKGFLRIPGGSITVFGVPGAGKSPGAGTTPKCINAGNIVAGIFQDKKSVQHGFVRGAKGEITIFDPPKSIFTNVTAINTAGLITGFFQTRGHTTHGYIRAADGSFAIIDIPGSGTGGGGAGTYVMAINDNGDVAGYIKNANELFQAYVRKANGTVTTFEAAGAGKQPNQGTIPSGINAGDAIAGIYFDKSDVPHGFVRVP